MTYSPRELARMALGTVLIVVVGSALYAVGFLIPMPGSKFLMFAPFLGMMMGVILKAVPRRGTLVGVSLLFSLLMLPVHVFMALAIGGSGVGAELLSLLLFPSFPRDRGMMVMASLYPPFALLSAFLVTVYVTGNQVFLLIDSWPVLLFLLLIVWLLGLGGAWLGVARLFPRLVAARDQEPMGKDRRT